MASPAMSHLICSVALVVLILVLPAFFAMEKDNVAREMAIRELTEISDYTSNTLENLYLLANSTNSEQLTITKELIYLPQRVDGSPYVLSVSSVDGVNASKVTAFLVDRSWIVGSAWLVPGLKTLPNNSLTIGDYTMEAVCKRESGTFRVWLEES